MKRQYEKGQAIVLIAAIMVGLIAMLGLAIDGGGLFFLKRDLQNATDAAIVAATYAKCSGSSTAQVEAAARTAAKKNGFSEGNPAGTVITVLQGPPDGVTVTNPDDYVRVSITSEKEKYFIQLVYDGEMKVSAKAVGKCNRLYNSANQRALFAGGSCGGNSCSLNITGSETDIVGGTHSNGCSQAPNDQGIEPPNSAVDTPPSRPIVPAPDPSPVIPMPIVYRTTDFDSSSDTFAIAAGANYYKITGNVTLPSASAGANKVTDAQMRTALIYVNGDVTLQGNGFGFSTYKFTIVTTGEIKQSGQLKNKTFSSYLNDAMGDPQYSLWLFTDISTSGCAVSSAGLQMSPSNVAINGMIYVPNAGVKVAFSGSTIYGAIWARWIEFSGSDSYFEYNPNGVPVSRTTISLPSD